MRSIPKFVVFCFYLTVFMKILHAESPSVGCNSQDENSFQTCSARDKTANTKNLPNIIFVLADDLGFTDVQYNNASIITPNIAKTAEEGIKLNQNYMQSWCTPSRYALMTGRYPIHIGKQHIDKNKRYLDPTGAPLEFELMPEKLKSLGYETHLVGKWDLGYCDEAYTPTRRGFDTFYGFWGGLNDYYSKIRYGVIDWKDGLKNAPTYPGTHSSYLFLDRIQSILDKKSFNIEGNPFFLLFATPLPHDPYQAPAKYYDMYPQIENKRVRHRNGLITMLDDTVGNLTRMIEDTGISNNTIFIFSSDNGPPAGLPNGPNEHDRLGAFRGVKADDFLEGGTRVPGFIKSPLLPRNFESESLLHVSDWYPTILRMAGVSSEEISAQNFDGVDQYDSFFNPETINEGPRKDMVYNIDEINNVPIGAVRQGWWKYAQYVSDGKLERYLYDLQNDATEKHNLANQDSVYKIAKKRKELTYFLLSQSQTMVPKDMPPLCPCPDSQPPCHLFSGQTGRPTNCTSCVNVDNNNSIKSGWCDIETKKCIF